MTKKLISLLKQGHCGTRISISNPENYLIFIFTLFQKREIELNSLFAPTP